VESKDIVRTGAIRRLCSPIFGTTALILLVAAVALDPAMTALDIHFRKTSILPRVSLSAFDAATLPSFKSAPKESPFLDPHPDDDAGTRDHVLQRLQERDANGTDGQVILFVTYYSDPNDQVPHTPEVCYRQIGGVVRAIGSRTVELGQGDWPKRVEVRTVIVEQELANAAIAYVFCANGRFYTRRNEVRLALGWPGDKRVYFSKIEAVSRFERDEQPDLAMARACKLLSEVLPALLTRHFPRQADLKHRAVGAAR